MALDYTNLEGALISLGAVAVTQVANRMRARHKMASNKKFRGREREEEMREVQNWAIELSDWGFHERVRLSLLGITMNTMPQPPRSIIAQQAAKLAAQENGEATR